MNSPEFRWLLPLYLAACTVSYGDAPGSAEAWWSLESLRQLASGPEATAVAYWAGPERANPDAAFLALHSPQSGFRSIVALKGGVRIRFDGKLKVEGAPGAKLIDSLDVAGVVAGGDAVLFHTERGLLRSAFSFDTGKVEAEKLRFTITGVAPGMWEVWRNGWVVDIGVPVREKEGVLHFSERPGSYFIRRLN